MHLVITDSGLGGLSICAALERALRRADAVGVRLTYVNAWPFDDRGYNDLPDMATRAAVFDRVLARIVALAPDAIVIACNTLSIVYEFTALSRSPSVPVRGIVDAGVSLFHEALTADPASAIVLLGTKTTIESGAHRDELVRLGIAPTRIAAVSCHGLAGAIERNPDGRPVSELLDVCASKAGEAQPPGGTLLVGLCCTHYGYVSDRITHAVATTCRRPVRALDPNQRLVTDFLSGPAGLALPATRDPNQRPAGELMPVLSGQTAVVCAGVNEAVRAGDTGVDAGLVTVSIVSKVNLSETTRAGITRLLEPVSPTTARALGSYAHVPDLF